RGWIQPPESPRAHRVAPREVLRRRQRDGQVGADRESAVVRPAGERVVSRRDADVPARGWKGHGRGVAARLDPAAGRLADEDRARVAVELGGEVRGGGEGGAADQHEQPAAAVDPRRPEERGQRPYVELSPPPFSRTSTITRRTAR